MDGDTATGRRGPISRREVVLLIALGTLLRVWWLVLVHGWTHPIDLGEASNVAHAFARTGTLADAYFTGQGPTAHLLPTSVVIAGAIEWAFGLGSAGATMALGCWALLQVAIGFALTTALFARLGASRATLLAGLGVLCLLPAPIASEAADFRVWEGGLAFDLAAANLLLIAMLAHGPVGWRALAGGAVLAAAAFFVSPPAGLAAVAAWAAFAWLRLTWRQALGLGAMAAAALAVPVVPWTLRNAAELGAPVMLRSNFGLELAIANHDGALNPDAPRAVRDARILAVHQSRERFAAAGGEVAYSRAVGATAWHWIGAHPLGFARLCGRHYRQFYVPDTWAEEATNWRGADRLRIRLFQLAGLLGLAGLAAGLWRRGRAYLPLALYVAVAGLPYALVQPIPRYGYITYPLLVFLAAQLILSPIRRPRAPGAAWAR